MKVSHRITRLVLIGLAVLALAAPMASARPAPVDTPTGPIQAEPPVVQSVTTSRSATQSTRSSGAAESEVKRRLLYLEPDPGNGGGAAPGGDRPARSPPCSRRCRAFHARSPCSTTSSRSTGRTSGSCDPGDRRDVLRPDPQADRGGRRHRTDRLTHEQSPADIVAAAHAEQRGREGGRRLRVRDVPPQQGERRHRQLRADDLPPSPTSRTSPIRRRSCAASSAPRQARISAPTRRRQAR